MKIGSLDCYKDIYITGFFALVPIERRLGQNLFWAPNKFSKILQSNENRRALAWSWERQRLALILLFFKVELSKSFG